MKEIKFNAENRERFVVIDGKFSYEIGSMYEVPMNTVKWPYVSTPPSYDSLAQLFERVERHPAKRVLKVVAFEGFFEGGACRLTKFLPQREVFWEEIFRELNPEGKANTGMKNGGFFNSGDKNSGIKNSGSCNSGDCNSGDMNSGKHNSGSCNSGDWNSGDWNSGDMNSGKYNSGDYNTGDWNSGDFNSGNHNLGDCNVGDFNSGSFNFGVFNTREKRTILMFDRPSDWTLDDWERSEARIILEEIPEYRLDWVHNDSITGGCLEFVKSSSFPQKWWNELPDDKKEIVKSLPNFDAQIFKRITGIIV